MAKFFGGQTTKTNILTLKWRSGEGNMATEFCHASDTGQRKHTQTNTQRGYEHTVSHEHQFGGRVGGLVRCMHPHAPTHPPYTLSHTQIHTQYGVATCFCVLCLCAVFLDMRFGTVFFTSTGFIGNTPATMLNKTALCINRQYQAALPRGGGGTERCPGCSGSS